MAARKDYAARKLAESPPDVAALISRAEKAEKQCATLEQQVRAAHAARAPKIQPAKRKGTKEDRLIVVLPDTHGSEMDKQVVAAVLADLDILKPDVIVHLGDLNECAGFSSKHGAATIMDMDYSYDQDIKTSGWFIDELQKRCGEIHILEGNHDFHLERWAMGISMGNRRDAELIRRRLAPEELMDFRGRGIKYYRRHEFHSGLSARGVLKIGKAHFLHGLMQGGNKPEQMIATYGVSTFFGHTHKLAMAVTPNMNSSVGSWNCGTLSKIQPSWRHGDFTKFSNGYGIINMAKSGAFQPELISIINGESLLRTGR